MPSINTYPAHSDVTPRRAYGYQQEPRPDRQPAPSKDDIVAPLIRNSLSRVGYALAGRALSLGGNLAAGLTACRSRAGSGTASEAALGASVALGCKIAGICGVQKSVKDTPEPIAVVASHVATLLATGAFMMSGRAMASADGDPVLPFLFALILENAACLGHQFALTPVL
jgi:hypothetical protein